MTCLVTALATAAPPTKQPSPKVATKGAITPASRSAGSIDGLAILSAALDPRHRITTRRDCSHFVHDIYEQAGFSYQYASSPDLYAGVDEFRLVTNPQPGDLAVWRGHAGIIVNPAQHTFFSLLSSGPGVDQYDSPYWKRKGRPRFLRYVKAPPSVTSSPIRNASWKRFARSRDDEAGTDDPSVDESTERAAEAAPPAKLEQVQPHAQPEDAPVRHAIVVSSPKPQPAQVRDAFLQGCRDAESSLRGRDLFKSSQSLVVFGQLTVKKIHLSRNDGWVEVQIDEPVSLSDKKADVRKRTEHQRWTLTRRDRTSWELTPAPNTIYVTQTTAVHLLANELAQLTESTDSADKAEEKAQLARALNALLANSHE